MCSSRRGLGSPHGCVRGWVGSGSGTGQGWGIGKDGTVTVTPDDVTGQGPGAIEVPGIEVNPAGLRPVRPSGCALDRSTSIYRRTSRQVAA